MLSAAAGDHGGRGQHAPRVISSRNKFKPSTLEKPVGHYNFIPFGLPRGDVVPSKALPSATPSLYDSSRQELTTKYKLYLRTPDGSVSIALNEKIMAEPTRNKPLFELGETSTVGGAIVPCITFSPYLLEKRKTEEASRGGRSTRRRLSLDASDLTAAGAGAGSGRAPGFGAHGRWTDVEFDVTYHLLIISMAHNRMQFRSDPFVLQAGLCDRGDAKPHTFLHFLCRRVTDLNLPVEEQPSPLAEAPADHTPSPVVAAAAKPAEDAAPVTKPVRGAPAAEAGGDMDLTALGKPPRITAEDAALLELLG